MPPNSTHAPQLQPFRDIIAARAHIDEQCPPAGAYGPQPLWYAPGYTPGGQLCEVIPVYLSDIPGVPPNFADLDRPGPSEGYIPVERFYELLRSIPVSLVYGRHVCHISPDLDQAPPTPAPTLGNRLRTLLRFRNTAAPSGHAPPTGLPTRIGRLVDPEDR